MDRYLIFQYVRTYMRCALNFGDTCTLRELVVSQRQSETVNGINYIFIFTWRGNALVHRWTQVLQNGKQFVLHYFYPSSYFYIMKMCHARGKEMIVVTTNTMYLWPLVTQIFHSDQPSRDGDHIELHVLRYILLASMFAISYIEKINTTR